MFSFDWPIMFCLLPLLWLLERPFPITPSDSDYRLRTPLLTRINRLSNIVMDVRHAWQYKTWCRLLAWILIIVAAANPQWLGAPMPLKQSGRNVMLAVDLSPSMSIPDLKRGDHTINRLQSVKDVADHFIDQRLGDKLGLILFGSQAYLQTPLTFDRQTVRHMLRDASIGLAGESTAIGDALGLGIKKLMLEDKKSRVLILLTDGANNAGVISPQEALQIAKQQNITIYTIGIGATSLEINSFLGRQRINPSADLDEGLLKEIANETHGQYFRAEDQAALQHILESINQLEPISLEAKSARPVIALFYWPLAGALLLTTFSLMPLQRLGGRR